MKFNGTCSNACFTFENSTHFLMTNFNSLAPIYDRLVHLVFGCRLWKAQEYHLHKIQPTHSVLILGGGTGRIMKWLTDCNVTYLEMSESMIAKAKKNGTANFICADYLHVDLERTFDWIICPFFLDCFPERDLITVLEKIKSQLKSDGQLIVTDFEEKTLGQKFLVKSMIVFFRVFASLPVTRLQPIRSKIQSQGFQSIEQKSFLSGFIFSDLYSY